jgi:hypothetical protein
MPNLSEALIQQMIEKNGGVEKAFAESGLKGSEKTMLQGRYWGNWASNA